RRIDYRPGPIRSGGSAPRHGPIARADRTGRSHGPITPASLRRIERAPEDLIVGPFCYLRMIGHAHRPAISTTKDTMRAIANHTESPALEEVDHFGGGTGKSGRSVRTAPSTHGLALLEGCPRRQRALPGAEAETPSVSSAGAHRIERVGRVRQTSDGLGPPPVGCSTFSERRGWGMGGSASRAEEEFAKWLREVRAGHEWLTYENLRRRTGIPTSTISNAFGGRHLPSYDNAQKLVRAISGDGGFEDECRIRWVAAKKAREKRNDPDRAEPTPIEDSSAGPDTASPDAPPAAASRTPPESTRPHRAVRMLIVGAVAFSMGLGLLYGYRAVTVQDDRRGADGGRQEGVDRNIAVYTELLDQPDKGLIAASKDEFIPSPSERRFLSTPYTVGTQKYLNIVRNSAEAIEVESVTSSILLTNERNQKIKIVNIEIDIVERGSPWSGTLFCVGPQAGGPNMQMLFDLDTAKPVARSTDATMEEVGPPFFYSRTIDLEGKGQETLAVRAVTKRSFVAFQLLVTYLIGQERKVVAIDNNGRPFRVTAFNKMGAGSGSYRRVFSMTPEYALREAAGRGKTGRGAPCGA
ncbi:helix-turn-helix domain-containing protein, partial [Streptomyces sp. NPDC055078]